MGNSLTPGLDGDLPVQESQRVRAHLEKILSTAAFSSSRRSQAFLRYVVEETLAGRSAHIKERNIGVDVFGKSESFDPQEESLVRVGAGEVRKRLFQAYNTPFEDGVRIELPVGSYCPVFRVGHLPSAQAEPVPSSPPPRAAERATLKLAFAAATAAAALGLAIFFFVRPSRDPLNLLWNSFSEHKTQVLIAMPSPLVFEWKNSDGILPNESAEILPANRLRQMQSYYIGIGAGLGAARFAEQLALRHQQFAGKFGIDVSFADLSQSPTILLGGFSSSMGIEMTKRLRYQLVTTDVTEAIVDTSGKGQNWKVPRWQPQTEIREGYALITILRHSESGHPLMVAAGLDISNTQAAVEFLTNAEYLSSFTRVAPRDWEKKNCQIVLHSFNHGLSPGRPTVVTSYIW